jgi:hypothetical protein
MRFAALMLMAAGVVGFTLSGCGGSGGSALGSPTTTGSTTAPATTAPATTTPATTGGDYEFLFRDFEGEWSGSVGKSDTGTDYLLTLTFASSPETTPGRAEIQALDCVGTVPYRSHEEDGRYVFRLDWKPGACTDGTIWLKPLGPSTLSYHWEDGRGSTSDTTLSRG